jgi:serine kinase of HPr protein (carbohydrate metabolism regulator)
MKLQEIINKLTLNVLTVVEDKDITGVFISDMLSDVMSNAQSGNLWITVQSHKNIVSAANLIDISAVIVTYNKKVPEDTIELANRYHVVILSSPLATFELASRLVEAGIK